uniref:Uncharacterized protein n=1 Tax=Coccolithus braarudii TaxID=221442 RepID=A0A7S0PVZ2_9EUKA|mmetsp:Transcript_17994/g.38644  ORF Transcript_17994/g.38644 Transcript_17994/m.38644 type:complete len:199 (+) Transcript_17994:545-1141(+)
MSGGTASVAKKTVQPQLFAGSRLEFQVAVGQETSDMPTPAAHERDRGPKSKPPIGVRGRHKQGFNIAQTKVPITQRLNEFPNQSFRDSCGVLLCGSCHTVLPNLKSVIKQHLSTAKHEWALVQFHARSTQDLEIMTELGQYFRENPNLAGSTNVSEHDQLFRYRTTETLMHAGILSKADDPFGRCSSVLGVLRSTSRT